MLEFDPAGDFLEVVDRLEEATLHRTLADESLVVSALRRAVDQREVEPSEGAVTTADVTWHLSVEEVAEAPVPGDLIEDAAGNNWTVLEVQAATVGARWACRCRNLAVAARLDTLVSIWSATYAKDETGEAISSWTLLQEGVRARIQPDNQAADVARDGDTVVHTVRIVLASPLPTEYIGADLRIVDATGRTFRSLRYEQAERIDTLPVVVAVETTYGEESSSSSSSGE